MFLIDCYLDKLHSFFFVKPVCSKASHSHLSGTPIQPDRRLWARLKFYKGSGYSVYAVRDDANRIHLFQTQISKISNMIHAKICFFFKGCFIFHEDN